MAHRRLNFARTQRISVAVTRAVDNALISPSGDATMRKECEDWEYITINNWRQYLVQRVKIMALKEI
jgi:hypothetical protein